MEAQALISVIVPVYNVSTYLRECLDSIVVQTYSNLEIILVDDGSTDISGEICDEYAANYPYIRVIHQENGGLSNARNSGIDAANGEYVIMIDSDDWVEPQMIEELYKEMAANPDVFLVNSQPLVCKENGKTSILIPLRDKFTIAGKEVLRAMLAETSNHYIWTKLFRKSILDNVRFKEGRLDEDTLFTYEICKEITERGMLMTEIPMTAYHYRQRDDSIAHKSSVPLRLDRLKNLEEIRQNLAGTYPEMTELVDRLAIRTSKWLMDDILYNPQLKREHFLPFREKLRSISDNDARKYLSRYHYWDFLRIKYLPGWLVGLTDGTVRFLKFVRDYHKS